jgi:hypothetical protein
MGVGFDWQDWALAALALTGVEPHEVMQVLTADRRWPRRALGGPQRLPTLTVWGRTRAGRPLIVATRHIGGRDYLIIGAREMTADELGDFEAWEAGR